MSVAALGWLANPSHHAWLRGEEQRLLDFPRQLVDASGRAVILDHVGAARPGPSAPTFITGRMAYAQSIAALRGHPGARPLARALLQALAAEAGPGWPDNASGAPDAPQSLYVLDTVLLAAAAGVALGEPVATGLLARALERLDAFSITGSALGVDRLDAAGAALPYRGMNANMHLVECLLAVSDATGAPEWRERAGEICRFVIAEASGREWRIVEHYDADWRALPEHNRDHPDHAFVPYGSTVGHGFEWARLIAQCSTLPGTDGFLDAANALFERARLDGWARDGVDGFLYTVDWAGRPVSGMKLHWVAAEAVGAASVLARMAGGAPDAAQHYEQWFDHIAARFIDREAGSWRARLDVGPGDKTDLYHSLQAVVIPQVPVGTSLLAALRPRG